MKLAVVSLFFVMLSFYVKASNNTVRIELYNQFNVKTMMVSPIDGKYEFTTNKGRVYKLKKNSIIYFTIIRDSISVWDLDSHLGMFKWIQIKGLSRVNAFKIEPAYPALPSRYYEGDLRISANGSRFHIENTVLIDSYLAGVVEAESGPNAPFEFYKAQAIISRTYLLELVIRQGIDKYKIGDDVNHQVYKGMSLKNPLIKQAVTHTNSLVIIDTTNQLIIAAFYSNSGGSTANSEDVWLTAKSYLRAIQDPFSLNQRNSTWRDSVVTTEWLEYLTVNGIDVSSDNAKIDNLHFKQIERQKYYYYNNDSIALRKIRKDFKLRSTWFSISPKDNYLIFDGKGYGHAVGLSQEGAMQMARQNYSFVDIISFYYKNVKVVNYNTLL